MKRIYVVSLDDEVPLTPKVRNNIKILCSIVYDEIRGIEYDTGMKILHSGNNIKYNELREREEKGNYIQHFINNTPETGEYEPFMVSDRAFAFTINNDLISVKDLEDIIYVDRIYCENPGKFNIYSVAYEEDKKDKNRLMAISSILKKENGLKEDKNHKTRIKSIIPLIGIVLR